MVSMANKLKKRFSDVFTLSARTNITHGTRHRAPEYKGRKKRTVTVMESFCGRKKEALGNQRAVRGSVDCVSCIKAMAAEANRK